MERRGFTLIELLVVISIIALLSSVVLASLNVARDKARLSAGKQFSGQIDRVAGELAAGVWDFDECSGTTAVDRSGFGHDGALVNMTTSSWSSDTPSGAGCSILFDGLDDEISVASGDLIGAEPSFTISAWIKPETSSLGAIYGEFTSSGASTRNFLLVNGGKLTFDQWPSSGGSFLASTASINAGVWTHVAYVQSSSTRSLYIDGRLDARDSAAEVYSGGTPSNARIGFRGSGQLDYAFQGLIDQVRVFTKDLTAAEVGKLYAEGVGLDKAASR